MHYNQLVKSSKSNLCQKSSLLISVLASFYIIFSSVTTCQATCSVEVWAYQSNKCAALLPPDAIGTIFPDGNCNMVTVMHSSTSSDVELLPGNYRAMCNYNGTMLHFFESGCAYEDCRSLTVGADRCLMNTTTTSSMYARAAISFPVQKPEEATASNLFTCTGLSGVVSFVVFGDCSDPSCPRMESSEPTDIPPPSASSPSFSVPIPAPAPTLNENRTNPSSAVPQEVTTSNEMAGIIAGVSIGLVVALGACGYFLYRRGKKDAMHFVKDGVPTVDSIISPTSASQSKDNWTNEIIIDPSNDDVSTLGGATLGDLPIMSTNGWNDQMVKIEEDEYTASVNVDYDFVKNQFRTGAYNDDATVDDSRGTRSIFSGQTKASQYTTLSKLGLNLPPESGINRVGSVCFADDRSFERQYDDTDEEGDNESHDDFGASGHPIRMQNNKKTTRSFIQNSTQGNFSQPFEIRVAPGVLGMVLDTPGGGIPVVRAIKSTSVLSHSGVEIGDHLIAVDDVDVTQMPANQVSNLISTRSHLDRILVFARPK